MGWFLSMGQKRGGKTFGRKLAQHHRLFQRASWSTFFSKEIGLCGTNGVPPSDSGCPFFGAPWVSRFDRPLWRQAH